jgi:2,4-dienoyl-CoA reductase-like NADH-dependent reductase (Old Yellow Enzyme family)
MGGLELPNRIILSPMTTGFGFDEGAPQPDLIDYFEARTRDVGMAVVAFGAVSPEGRVERRIPWMWRDDAAAVLSPLAEAIAANGAVPCLQLGHGGRQVSPRVIGTDPVAPSAVAPDVHVRRPPRELSIAQIEDLVVAFADAAVKARDAGFLAVEVHAAHGYLIQQFLATGSNLRTDRYGGDTVTARARFGSEVISAIKASAPDLAVLVRINGSDLVPGGLTEDDAAEAAPAFAGAGADAFVVSAGVYGSVPYTIPLFDDPEGTFLGLAERVRSAVDIPVAAVGRITEPATAEQALAAGICDAVAVGRALLADPDWATKARENRPTDIRPCIGTVEGCAGMLQHGDPISCSVNPDVGRERTAGTTTTNREGHIVVVGGGPAGLEAARSAAAAGHRVTLLEREDRVGGGMALAAHTPPLRHLRKLMDWYEREIETASVDVHLGVDAGPGTIAELSPDHVLLATGSVTAVPVLDGYDTLPVWTLESMLAGEPSTLGSTKLPIRVAVVGNGRRALAMTLWLADRGREAVAVTSGRAGIDTSGLARRALLQRIEFAETFVDPATPRRVTADGLVTDHDGEERLIECDGVVIADPVRPHRPTGLEGIAAPITIIGDAREPRGIGPAITEARDTVRALA